MSVYNEPSKNHPLSFCVHLFALYLCTFSIFYPLFKLHSFYVGPIPCCAFLILYLFHVAFIRVVFVIAKMDSSQHTVLTNLIIFSYQTTVNIYIRKYERKMFIQIKILANHYHSWLIKLTLSKIVISIIPNVAT